MILDNEATIPKEHLSGSMPFKLVDEPESVHLDIFEDTYIDHSGNPSLSSIDRLFAQGFRGDEDFGPISEEPPLFALLMTLVAPTINTSISSTTTPRLLLLPHMLLSPVKKGVLLAGEEE